MKKDKPKVSKLSRLLKFLKHKWNSMLYWLMFKNVD